MLTWLRELSDWVWQDRLWFPAGLGWADLKDRDGLVFAKGSDLWVIFPIAVCFLIIRQIFERTVAVKLASLLRVREKPRVRAAPNTTLEFYFCNASKFPSQSSVEELTKQSGCSVRQVQRWFRRRRNQERPSQIKKFREASWRFTFYLLAFIAGLGALIDKPWFYDMEEMWNGFPTLPLLPSQYWYYMIELGFYISLLFSVATDVKRKSAKMFNYAEWRKTCNYIFILFAAVFILTRLVILPFWILHTTWVYPLTIYPPFFGFYFFNGLLLVLQCLHIFWAVLILRMAIKFLPGNDIVEDERSDREETDSDEEEEDHEKTKNGFVQNGNGHTVLNNNHHHSKTD
ncbi:unnamed protein product [Oncorhynchus mykiss]|uniref:Homeobox domain-containing protein n=1 Tax=Oncorhynchus mykiss TaxID=8022 RepID=A0A060VWH1_ONCMY|nr:unnamed protein product [Oncorhynchus mykiss]